MDYDVNSTWVPNEEAIEICGSLFKQENSWNGCNATSDTLICWPPATAGSIVYQPCFKEFRGLLYDSSKNASRICFENSTWGRTNFNECTLIGVVPELTVNTDDTEDTVNIIIYLFIAGHCLSLIMTTLAIFVFCWFKELKCLRNKIHTNLMASYFLTCLIWLLNYTNLSDTGSYKCVLLVLPLYYFTLTNYFWAFIEGMYLFILVVDTFFLDRVQLRTYLAIGWGIPLIIISIWAVVKLAMPIKNDLNFNNLNSNKNYCPLMTYYEDDLIYVIPIMIVLFVNLIYLIKIMWVLVTKIRSTNLVERHNYKKATKALFVLIPLLGLTFFLDFINPSSKTSDYKLLAIIFKYSRVVFVSMQGFTVSLLYCFFNREVQNTLKDHIIRWKEKRRFIVAREQYGQSWMSQKKQNTCNNMNPNNPWSPVENTNGRSSSCISNGTTSSALSTTRLLSTAVDVSDEHGDPLRQ